MKKKIAKFTIILILILPITLFLNNGFVMDSLIENLQSVFFALILSLSVVWQGFKKYIFLISVFLILGMAPFYVLNFMDWANILGSSGFGLILLLIMSFLPQLIRKGYIEKL